MKRLETLYQDMCDGKISVDRAQNIIIDVIYKNKCWFGLGAMEMDDLHDFLIYYMERVKNVVGSFNPNQGSFASYLYGSITNAIFSWNRRKKIKSLEEKSFGLIQELYFEESSGMYAVRDGHVVCQESDMRHSVEEVEEFKKRYHPVDYSDNKHYTYKKGLFKDRMEKLRKEAILILILKCCYSMKPDEIEKASVLLGMDIKELSEMIAKAREEMSAKKKILDDIKMARDNAFFFKRKYSMISDSSNDAYRNEIIKEKEAKKDKKWRDKNTRLKRFRSITPSNITVSKILGMSDRHVKYIPKSAEKPIDNISLKGYYDWHENLFGKRKSEQKAGNE